MRAWLHAGLVELEHLPELARAAEQTGFHGLALSDHVLYPRAVHSPYPYGELPGPAAPFPDAWVTIAALAAVTTRLRFVTKIYLAAARPPLLVARAVATAAILSGDRVALGVGAGWMREEFTIMGEDFGTRGARLDEHLEVIRKLWGAGWVEHHGRHYDFPELRLSPTPARRIPLYGGGEATAALRRAAGLDGWLGAAYAWEGLAELLRRLDVQRRAVGSNRRHDFVVMAGLRSVPTLEDCRQLEGLGVTDVSVAPWSDDPPPPGPGRRGDLRAAIERFGEAVVSRL